MIYSKNNFLYVHIWKTGGTNVTRALGDYADPDIRNGIYHNHIPASGLRELVDDYDNIFKFTLVRNTWDWMLSHYFHIIQSVGHPDYNDIVTLTFSEFLYWVRDEGLTRPRKLPHTIADLDVIRKHGLFVNPYFTYTDFLKDDGEVIVDYIGYTHDFQNSMDHICDEIGMDRVVTDKVDSRIKTLGNDYTLYYTDSDVDLVYELYKEDIDWLGFKFGDNIII